MKDKPEKRYIYFPMEKRIVRIFYLGIAQGEYYTGGRKQRKNGLPVRLLDYRPQFPGGCLEIAYALLPEYAGKILFTGRGRKWKDKVRQTILQRTLECVKQMPEHREIVDASGAEGASAGIQEVPGGFAAEVPWELVAAHLHSKVPFEQVCVFFSEDGGAFEAREAIFLLAPYLRKMRQVTVIGKDSVATELFSDYLYYEYGLVPDRYEKMVLRACGASEKVIYLDLGGKESFEGDIAGKLETNWCINRGETLKFLDTVIKNGYNTES